MKVLIVEDDPQATRYLEQLVTGAGHAAEKAVSCKQTLDLVNQKSFDLLLLDIFLPDGLGYEIIPQVRSLSPDTNIIAMTGQNNRDLEQKVREQGVLFYMIKPLDIQHLKSILAHLDHKLKEA